MNTPSKQYKGGIQAKGILKQDPEANIWAQEGLHHEELHSLYRSPNIVREIKYRRLRWARHVSRMGVPNLTFQAR
jgi:hypothetical protein